MTCFLLKMLFPLEVWEQIFFHVDPVTLTGLKLVCKSWKCLIDKVLKVTDQWYIKCKEDIPQNAWHPLFEKLCPTNFYSDLEEVKGKSEIWMRMYKWWNKSKRILKLSISITCMEPLPKHRTYEDITCAAVSGEILALGTTEGYIYFFNINNLHQSIYVADHMEFLCNVQFLRAKDTIIAVSCCLNGHVKFWDVQLKKFLKQDQGKLLCTSYSYCYTVTNNFLVVQGAVYRTLYEFPVDDFIALTANGNKVSLFAQDGRLIKLWLDNDEEVHVSEFITPPTINIRRYYLSKTDVIACVTDRGYLGVCAHDKNWQFHDLFPILHGTPSCVLVYTHLFILGLDTGLICIYCIENFDNLNFDSLECRQIVLDTEAITSLDVTAHPLDYLVATTRKKVFLIQLF